MHCFDKILPYILWFIDRVLLLILNFLIIYICDVKISIGLDIISAIEYLEAYISLMILRNWYIMCNSLSSVLSIFDLVSKRSYKHPKIPLWIFFLFFLSIFDAFPRNIMHIGWDLKHVNGVECFCIPYIVLINHYQTLNCQK